MALSIPGETWRVELCADCVFVDANGMDAYEEAWRDAGETEDRYTGFLPEWQGWEFSPQYEDACENECLDCDRCRAAMELQSEPHFVRPGTRCDGCGSGLGGDRWDYWAVLR